MPKVKFTDQFIRKIKTEKTREEFSDTLKLGLGLRVTKKGAKSFIYRYRMNGKQKRYTIGRYPDISLAKARSLSDDLYVKIKQGIDVHKVKVKKRHQNLTTVKDLAERFKKEHLPSLKASTSADYEARIDNHIIPGLGHLELKNIERHEIIIFLKKIATSTPIQSNRIRAILSSMFSFGMNLALCDDNPVRLIKPMGRETSRERVYTENELKDIWKAFGEENQPYKQLLQILLYTGQRLGETRKMKWADIKGTTWTIPAKDTKAKRQNIVPLAPQVIAIIDEMRIINGNRTHVFQSTARIKDMPIQHVQNAARRVSESSKVSDFRIHDLRRTAATYMAESGVDRTVLGKVLNHKSLAGDSGVTAIYDRHDYLDEKREALEEWANNLEQIVDSEDE